MRNSDSRRGSFLAQAMMLCIVLAIIVSCLLQLTLSRNMLVYKANDAASSRQLALGVEAQVHACLDGSDFEKTCSITSSACLPASIGGRAVRIRASGSPPDCSITLEIAEEPPR